MDEITLELLVVENDVQTLEEYLDALAGYKIGEGTYTEDVTFHVLLSRTHQEILTENGSAFFEVPVQYFLQGDGELELSDIMVVRYSVSLQNHTLTFIDTVDEEERPYEGPLEACTEDVKEYVQQTFKEVVWES